MSKIRNGDGSGARFDGTALSSGAISSAGFSFGVRESSASAFRSGTLCRLGVGTGESALWGDSVPHSSEPSSSLVK